MVDRVYLYVLNQQHYITNFNEKTKLIVTIQNEIL